MKKFSFILLLAAMFAGGNAWGQLIENYNIDAVHGDTLPLPSAGMRIYDDGGAQANYRNGVDYWVTVTAVCDSPYVLTLGLDLLDLRFTTAGIPCGDTLFVYDGPTINDSLIWYATGNVFNPYTRHIYMSPQNTTNMLTIRFKSCDCSGIAKETGSGFNIIVSCDFPCETFTPYIDSIYYKTRNGEIYEFGRVKQLLDIDSMMVWDSILLDSVMSYDTTPFSGVNLCLGDGVIFTAHCEYSNSCGWYHPTDSTTTFTWSMGTGDTILGLNKTSVYYNEYLKIGCYDVVLGVVDERGCGSSQFPAVKVRTAQNPLKTLFTLDEICNRDSLLVNMGFSGEDATLVLRKIQFDEVRTKVNDARVFIPDGPNCQVNCYTAPVRFDEYPSGMAVTDKKDICSICVNYEHSYMGDYQLAIICPSNNKAVLKYQLANQIPANGPQGTGGGGSRYTGIPYGGNNDSGYDKMLGGNYCDSIYNPYGVGWNYCFSRNGDYTLVSGEAANVAMPTNAGMANGPTVSATQTFWNIPAGYVAAGQTCGTVTTTTLDSSDHENKSNYYTPADDFSTLIGCPLNGEWNIEICDYFGIDNGWVFSWSMDICNVGQSKCRYQVGIDSLIWYADTASQYCDYELGHYRGAEVHRHNDVEAYILTPDTAGTFKINVSIYDEFGCVWDTNTHITSYWTPKPSLGNDTNLCGVYQTLLDANDVHSKLPEVNYKYVWSPFGQTTDTITTAIEPGRDITYVVQVTNDQGNKVCVTRDTIDIFLRRQPYPSFVPTPFTLEGCDPLTLTFDNQSIDGYKHFWDFGDGNTSDLATPTHTYAEGIYKLKYYIVSEDGCEDSLIYDKAIAVYKAPKAAFAWEPVYPSVLTPNVQFTNLTTPRDEDTRYFWEFQYSKEYPLSVHTMIEDNPVFDYSAYTSTEDIAGNYSVKLISESKNMAPSGNFVYCSDTTEATILMVNDFLQFPNVVTPNGDGINDRFVIKNLVDGLGYPINSLYIYNKWGTMVFHRDNIATDDDWWDPAGVPAGTYFFRFTGRGYNGNVEHNGAVEAIK